VLIASLMVAGYNRRDVRGADVRDHR
jgi:hypothetical protein